QRDERAGKERSKDGHRCRNDGCQKEFVCHGKGVSGFMRGETETGCAELSTRFYSEAPSGRKYCVLLTGSWSRLRSCCKSSLRSTKSISEVLITRRSEAE